MNEHPRITEVGRLLARIADLEAENEALRRERDEQVAAALQERDDVALAMEAMRREKEKA